MQGELRLVVTAFYNYGTFPILFERAVLSILAVQHNCRRITGAFQLVAAVNRFDGAGFTRVPLISLVAFISFIMFMFLTCIASATHYYKNTFFYKQRCLFLDNVVQNKGKPAAAIT